jgi:hypothetical protein
MITLLPRLALAVASGGMAVALDGIHQFQPCSDRVADPPILRNDVELRADLFLLGGRGTGAAHSPCILLAAPMRPLNLTILTHLSVPMHAIQMRKRRTVGRPWLSGSDVSPQVHLRHCNSAGFVSRYATGGPKV